MVNVLIKALQFLILIVPLMVAIVECNDKDNPKPDPTPEFAALPQVFVPAIAGDLVIDLPDGTTENTLQEIEMILGVPVHWFHPESRDEALAVAYVNNMQHAAHLLVLENIETEAVEPMMEFTVSTYNGTDLKAAINSMTAPVNDPLYPKQWHLDAMGAPYGWANTPAGKGVIVAVADTGVTIVEDLKDTKVLEGKSFVGGSWRDGHGHGTHVSGTIAQATNNGVGTAGVAPNATILPVKVLGDSGGGTSAGIATGIDWAVDQGAQIINLSLGGGYSKVIHTSIQKANKAGVIVVAACGNSARSGCDYPGGLAETIGVSATGPTGNLAFYSSYGPGVSIAAPGGDKQQSEAGGVLQNVVAGGGTKYEYYQGTSMATPHVVGAAAVLLSTGMSSDEVKQNLLDNADNSDNDKAKFGAGKLDLEASIKANPTNPGGFGHNHLGLSIIAGLLALGLGLWSKTSRAFMVKTAVVSTLAGGGLWFLAEIPYLNGFLVQLLSLPLLEWPNLFIWNGAAGFPLWASAVVPGIICFVGGMNATTRPLAGGLAFGWGASLVWAAAAGTVSVWAVPSLLGLVWLVANGFICVGLGMGMCGAQTLEEQHNVA